MSRTKKIAVLAIIAMVLTLMPAAMFAATADSTRLSGAGRVETALDIASAGTWGTSVVLAPADQANLVDALAAAPLAGQENAPILLTFKGSLDAAVKAKIAALGATKVYVVGAISDAVAAEVDAMAGVTVETLKGAGRQATAAAINAKLTSPAGTFVVGYDAIPDALSVASYAARNKFAIVLASQDGSVASSSLVGATKYIVGGTTKVDDIAGVTRIAGADRFATNNEVAKALTFTYDRIYIANGLSCVDALSVAPLAAKYNAFVALASSSDVAAAATVNAKLSATSKVIAVGGSTAVSNTVVGIVIYGGLAVKSVSSINATQIQIVFNKVVDKATLFADGVSGAFVANTVAINTLDTIASGALTGKLSDDGLTLTVTATNALSKRYDVVVDLIKAKTGETITKYTQMYTFAADTTAPTIVSTTKVSSSVYKVIFSEPMKTLGTVTYTFADNTAAVVATDFAAGKSEVLFTIDAGVAVGKVITAQFIGAQDQNNNILATNPATTTFTKGALDGTKPTLVSITQTGAITFNVKFSEELAANPTVAIVGNATTKTEKDTSDATNYKITVTNPLEGATVVGVTAFTDLSGEAGDNTSRVISFVKDIASPKVTSTAVVADTADGKQYLEITFDRDVTVVGGSTVDAVGSYVKDYVTTNIDPAAVAVAYKNVDNKRLVRVALANLVAGADTKAAVYTVDLAFANLNSTAGIAADAVKAVSFTRGEDGVGASTAKVAVVAGTVKQGVDNNKVEVVFDKAVDGASATAVNNYSVAGAVVQSVTLLAVGADTPAGTVTAATEQAVVLNLQAGSNLFTGLRNITITNVKALGSSVAIDAYTGTVNIKENVVPTITSAKLTALNKVTLTFSEKVDTLAVDTDFELYIGGSKLAANDLVSTAAGDDVTTVVLTLEADVTAANIASGLTLKAISGTINIVDTAGNKISVPSTGVTVTQ